MDGTGKFVDCGKCGEGRPVEEVELLRIIVKTYSDDPDLEHAAVFCNCSKNSCNTIYCFDRALITAWKQRGCRVMRDPADAKRARQEFDQAFPSAA